MTNAAAKNARSEAMVQALVRAVSDDGEGSLPPVFAVRALRIAREPTGLR